jgi:hypothetical protein
MGSIGDNFPFPAPVLNSNDWANLIDVIDELITRVESPVPLSSLEGGNLDMDGNSIINVEAVEFQEESAPPAADPGKVYFYADEWWLVTTAGAIQITDNGSLNVTSVGGIAGDYGGVNPASARFVDVTNRYDFYDDFGVLEWAFVRGRGFDIAAGIDSTFRARLLYGGAGNLDFTLPPEIPGADRGVLQVDSTGQITFNQSGTPVNNNLYLGDGELKYTTERTIQYTLPHSDGWVQSGTFTTGGLMSGRGTLCTVAGTIHFPIRGLDAGWRIKSAKLYLIRTNGAVATTFRITRWFKTPAFGAPANTETTSLVTSVSPNTVTMAATVAGPTITTTSEVWNMSVDALPGDDLLALDIVYDIP